MITIRIGNETKNFSDYTESWINQQIQRQQHHGQNVCVQVTINVPGLDLPLSTPGCGGGRGGGGRLANEKEREVLDLWHKLGLDQATCTIGNLIAFLKQLKRWVS
jgi:hypothetical protein